MSLFKLKYDESIVMLHDTDFMEPGELSTMKDLARYGRWQLERVPKDSLPNNLHRDPLIDVALHNQHLGGQIATDARICLAKHGITQ